MYSIFCNVCKQTSGAASPRATTCSACLEKGLKWCTKCHTVKSVTDFPKQGAGLCPRCKACESIRIAASHKRTGYYTRDDVKSRYVEYNKQFREGHKEEKAAYNKAWNEEHYANDEDYRARLLVNSRAYKKRHQATDEQYRAKKKARAHMRRSVSIDNALTAEEWRSTIEMFNSACAYCGSTDDMTMDHVVPIASGGLHVFGNVVPACRSCNSSKGARELATWYTSQKFFDSRRLEEIEQFVVKTGGDD